MHVLHPHRPVAPGSRVLVYSPDSYGLGHLRRAFNLAGALAEGLDESEVLVACSSPCATHFAVPEGVDVVKLPSATKDAAGRYRARTLRRDLAGLVDLRGRILLETFEAFDPDLLVVDHRVLGLEGELAPVLRAARRRGTRTLLGLRDVIDAPDAVAREWGTPEVRRALAEDYDRVCVYGVPEVCDPRVEYPIPPELGERVEFLGYVVRPERDHAPRALPTLKPQVLVTVGGGEDGGERVETWLEALEGTRVPFESTVVLGPLLDTERARALKRRARLVDGVTVHRFHADLPRLLAQADAVVGMAGYNTVCEILQSRTPAVLVPRTFPRREQLIRAERLERLGLCETLDRPSPDALLAAVGRALERGRLVGPLPALDGRERLCALAAELVAPRAARRAGTTGREPSLEIAGSDR